MSRPKTFSISLEPRERRMIQELLKKSNSTNRRSRCSIILNADEAHGKIPTYSEIAKASGTCINTVIATLKSFCTKGLETALSWQRNPNSDHANLKATGDIQARVIAKACSAPPKGYSRWTLSLLEEEMAVVLEVGLSRSTIGRILKNNDLRPHLSEYWCIPPKEDADFVAGMEDILDVYQQPYDPQRPLWYMDEKPFQLLGESREPMPMRPGSISKLDSEYVRNGTVSIFCFIQPHSGRILHKVLPTRTAVDWAEQVRYLVDEVNPDAEKVVLVMDNLNVHSVGSLYK